MQEFQNESIREAKIAIEGIILIALFSAVVEEVDAATSSKVWLYTDLLPSKKVPTNAVARPVVTESSMLAASVLADSSAEYCSVESNTFLCTSNLLPVVLHRHFWLEMAGAVTPRLGLAAVPDTSRSG